MNKKMQILTLRIKRNIRMGLMAGTSLVEMCKIYHVRVTDVRTWLHEECGK